MLFRPSTSSSHVCTCPPCVYILSMYKCISKLERIGLQVGYMYHLCSICFYLTHMNDYQCYYLHENSRDHASGPFAASTDAARTSTLLFRPGPVVAHGGHGPFTLSGCPKYVKWASLIPEPFLPSPHCLCVWKSLVLVHTNVLLAPTGSRCQKELRVED